MIPPSWTRSQAGYEGGAEKVDEAKTSKGWRRLVAISCTLLLAGSLFLFLGMTVWAQEQPTETETTTEETTTEQPAETQQTETTTGQGLTIEYWEPQIGTRTVYYINDWLNDEHGDYWDTSELGYYDDWQLYNSVLPRAQINFASSYYKNVEATSNMNMCYFDLEGPWYFNMTTPFKIVREVKGIHEVPDAASFPQATYAISELIIGSGGHRWNIVRYMTNDSAAQEWHEWGYTLEYVPDGSAYSQKEIVHYTSSSDETLNLYMTNSFPISVGSTGTLNTASMSGEKTPVGSFEVVAEGQITVPGGAYNALLVKYEYILPESRIDATRIEYEWIVQDVGDVAGVKSLPNIVGPTYEEATGYYSERRDKIWYNSEGIWVLESFAAPAGG